MNDSPSIPPDLEILYEDNHLIAVFKEHGVLSQGDRTGDRTLNDMVKEWIAENQSGGENFQRLREEGKDHEVEVVGKDLRSMMPWIDTEF